MAKTTPQPPTVEQLSMPCWLESYGAAVKTVERKAIYHATCPTPGTCSCPKHKPQPS